MKSMLAPDFIDLFRELPTRIQRIARKNYQVWREDPAHPGLHFKLVGKRMPIYSASGSESVGELWGSRLWMESCGSGSVLMRITRPSCESCDLRGRDITRLASRGWTNPPALILESSRLPEQVRFGQRWNMHRECEEETSLDASNPQNRHRHLAFPPFIGKSE